MDAQTLDLIFAVLEDDDAVSLAEDMLRDILLDPPAAKGGGKTCCETATESLESWPLYSNIRRTATEAEDPSSLCRKINPYFWRNTPDNDPVDRHYAGRWAGSPDYSGYWVMPRLTTKPSLEYKPWDLKEWF